MRTRRFICDSEALLTDWPLGARRLMSDYEVNLVNDSMQEFYVRFYGPAESTSSRYLYSQLV